MNATMTDFEAFVDEVGLTQADLDAVKVEVAPLPAIYSRRVKLKESDIHGLGVFADHPFREGEIVGPMKLSGKWTTLGRYMNHEQNSNCEVRADGNFHVLKDVYRNEELTANYRQIKTTLTN